MNDAPPRPPVHPPARSQTIWEQTAEAATGWMYLAPFLIAAPFLISPPLWIAALTQLPASDAPDDPPREPS